MKKWNICSPDRPTVSKLMLGCGVTSLTAAALAAKGYSTPEQVMEKLNTDGLSDPFLIKDMKAAADTVNTAVEEGSRICVYGDYDCDGIMAASILYTYLEEIGADVTFYIPERSEGYGLNKAAVDKIHSDGVELIITVDNGISAIAEAEYIYRLGMKLVVTDHHQQGDSLPKAEAVVDPHRHDCPSPFKSACGAVIALKLVAALDGGDYTMALEQFGDLAAIATVADIVELTGENRFIVSYGMELINNSDRPAVIALKELAGIAEKPCDTQSIGFGIAPRINASGRFGSPRQAVELILCEDIDEARKLAADLDRLNTERKNTENSIISDIFSMISADPSLTRGRVIFLCGKGWHHGVIGIVASRIMEEFGKPCFIASEENGEIRGSARSFGKFSIFGALSYAADTLVKFGGHHGAGGFTIKAGMAENFRTLLEQYAAEQFHIMPPAELKADSPLTPAELTIENIKGLSVLEPFGAGNEKPLFYIENAAITDIRALKDGAHTKLRIKFGTASANALIFRKGPKELTVRNGDICDLIVSPSINEFRGNVSISLIVSDIRLHGFEQSRYFAGLSSFEAFTRGETLPDNYYPALYPPRDCAAKIYTGIPREGIPADTLYLRLADPKINYARFCTAAEALRQLGLITAAPAGQILRRVEKAEKVQLDSAPILAELRNKLDELCAARKEGGRS